MAYYLAQGVLHPFLLVGAVWAALVGGGVALILVGVKKLFWDA
jgi:hypothetical protein